MVLGVMLAATIAGAAARAADGDHAFLSAQQEMLFNQMQQDPTNLEVILAYAKVSAKLGDNEAAVSALQRLLLFNPNLVRANIELGALYVRMGSFAMARAYFGKAIAANPTPELKAEIDRYLATITDQEAPAHYRGTLLAGIQHQSDANLATASPLVNSPVGPLLLSGEFVKKPDENLFLAGSGLYTYDLGTANHDTFEVAGTSFLQRYFRVQRLDLDFGEVTAGPRLGFPDVGLPWVSSATLKPYVILNEVGLGQNQYFYTYGSGLEGTATVWQDLTAKVDFEFRHKTFTNAPDRPQSTGLDGNDKLVSLGLSKPVSAQAAVSLDLDYLDQDTSLPYYANKTYAASVGYRARYDDPTMIVGLPWETTVWGSRLWSFYDAPDPCCNTSGNPLFIGESTQRTMRWRVGLTQVVQLGPRLGIYLQLQRDIVSSNLPFYAYTSNSILIGPQFRFDATPGWGGSAGDDIASNGPDTASGGAWPTAAYRVEGNFGGSLSSTAAKGTLSTPSMTVSTNNVTATGGGITGGVILWMDDPLVTWTGNPALDNISLGVEYRHFSGSESAQVVGTIPAFGTVGGTANASYEFENLFVDAAWRLNSGRIHPYVGLGGGIALLDWKATVNAPGLAAFSSSSPTSYSGGIVAPVAAGHLFAGLDYDISPRLYVGLGADFYFTDVAERKFTHSNIQVNANQLSLVGHTGYRFD